MEKTNERQICFVPKGSDILLYNAVDRDGDGQLWKSKSGKWIPISLENGVLEKATTSMKQ